MRWTAEKPAKMTAELMEARCHLDSFKVWGSFKDHVRLPQGTGCARLTGSS